MLFSHVKISCFCVKLPGLWFSVHLGEVLVHYFVFQFCSFFSSLCVLGYRSDNMGKLLSKIFGNREMRILMLGLDAAGKTSIFYILLVVPSTVFMYDSRIISMYQ